MRVRNIKGIEQLIEKEAGFQFIKEPEKNKGHWQEVFGNNHKILIEIGCGKGKFISTMAEKHPDINYIAIEKVEEILYKAVLKGKNRENLKFLLIDGKLLTELFAKEEIDGVYLNFSDPWPKNRHHKRRLTSMEFLPQYKTVIKNGGKICLKTDNPILFEYSLNTMAGEFHLVNIALDYQGTPEIDDVPTEYEEKFREKGNPIYRLEGIKE